MTPPPPPRHAAIIGIGTAVPESVTQLHAAQLAERLSCESDAQRAWLNRVFSRTGVASRGTVLENAHADNAIDTLHGFYRDRETATDGGPGTAQRMQRYAKDAPMLAANAARGALEQAHLEQNGITHLITVSCTGFFAPGLDVSLINTLGISRDVKRLHVGFMGCHAAFNALEIARTIASSDASARVLICCVELCSLHYAYGWTPDKVVANSLFADGAAAAVVASMDPSDAARDTSSWQILGTASRLLENSLDAMTWRIGDNGFEMTLSAEVPALVGRHVAGWCEQWLRALGTDIRSIGTWAVHPGGPKVLTEAERALGLSSRALDASRAVLNDHGNMSSTTILFILQRLAANNARGRCVALGFGPGLMMEGMLLER